jgi:hypothetical protein
MHEWCCLANAIERLACRQRLAQLRCLREKLIHCLTLLLRGIKLLGGNGELNLRSRRLFFGGEHGGDGRVEGAGRTHARGERWKQS